MESMLLDVAGHRRSPATMPGYHRGRPPRNKGEHYPADPPTVEEIVAVMRTIGDADDGHRLRALIVPLWRAGLRISEALSLQESDLDGTRGAVLVRRGKGGKRREVGMDRWAWEHYADIPVMPTCNEECLQTWTPAVVLIGIIEQHKSMLAGRGRCECRRPSRRLRCRLARGGRSAFADISGPTVRSSEDLRI
jgi:hypothetical protein